MPGRRLLGLVDKMRRTARAMAQGVNRIARARLAGTDLARLAPAGFNPTTTNYLIVEAVSWSLALRQRLLAVVAPPAFASRLLKTERGPQARGAAPYLPRGMMEASEADDHDWRELARPWRMGQGGVAAAARAIEGMPDGTVISAICNKLTRGATALGANADIEHIAALAAAARALCPDAEAAPTDAGAAKAADAEEAKAADAGGVEAADAGGVEAADGGGAEAADGGGVAGPRAAGPPADQPESQTDDGPEAQVEDDPPKRPPDG